jgi:shikimate kinase
MTTPRHIRNIALIGFMGTGKTSVGHMVARRLRFDFRDTDHLIERRAGMTISEIFARHGEARFREIERAVVDALAEETGCVIATGGGVGANPELLDSLKRHALVICLWASPERIWQRVSHQAHRPLLQVPDPQQRIRELLAQRRPFYRRADVLLNADTRQIPQTAAQVIKNSASSPAAAARLRHP